MNTSEIHHLQQALNRFTTEHKELGFAPLKVDGDLGVSTKKRVREVKYLLGYVREHMDVKVDDNFFKRMNHPVRVDKDWGQTKDAVNRGKKRRAERRNAVLKNRFKAFLKPGVGTFDGIPVAKCAIPILEWCRANGWNGRLVSGWRDPKYSQHLCMGICGRPSCPGRCAGLSSNHVGNSPVKFAMDVSDYIKFGEVVAHCPIQPHVHNALPNDRVHFSPSGG